MGGENVKPDRDDFPFNNDQSPEDPEDLDLSDTFEGTPPLHNLLVVSSVGLRATNKQVMSILSAPTLFFHSIPMVFARCQPRVWKLRRWCVSQLWTGPRLILRDSLRGYIWRCI